MSLVFYPVETLLTRTTSYTSVGANQITLPAAVIASLNTALGTTKFTTISVSDGVNTEFMYLNGITSGAANVTRGVDGSVASPLANGAQVRFVWLVAGISAIAGSPTTTTLTGSGSAVVTGGPNYNVNVPPVVLTAGTAIAISGGPTNYTITNLAPVGSPGPTGPPGPSTVVTASGMATSTVISGGYNINVTRPTFVAGSGISIVDAGPTVTITNTQTPGGTGTVTSVTAGAGIAVTGTPTVAPVVSLTTTGISAGTYGGVTVDAYGRISAIASGFVTSVLSTTPALVVSNPVVGTVSLAVSSGSTVASGILQLAPTSAMGSDDPGNSTQAVTPAGVHNVIAGLNILPATIAGTGFQAALGAPSYTDNIAGLTSLVTILAGKTAVVDIYVEAYDTATPTTPISFAVGLFNGATLLAGNSQIPSSTRNLKYIITGPLNATLTVNTTALTGTETLGSYFITITNN